MTEIPWVAPSLGRMATYHDLSRVMGSGFSEFLPEQVLIRLGLETQALTGIGVNEKMGLILVIIVQTCVQKDTMLFRNQRVG